jgi:outer membrane protein assembly complex protein YaeT
MGALLALLWLAAAGAPPPVAAVVLEVPEADRARLARYVGIEPGAALDPEAVRGAVERLYATGEFADVLVERRDTATGLELRFRPVPAPRLAEVRVEGDRVVSAATIRRLGRLLAGEPLWRDRLDHVAQAVAVDLVARGYLEARVTAEARPAGALSDAVFDVAAGPRVRVSRVTIKGAPATASAALRQLARPAVGAPFERQAAQKAAEKMRRQLVEHSRWRARVDLHESYDPLQASMALSFVVAAGPWLRLEFEGDRPSASLRGAIESMVRAGGVAPDALDEGVERLEDDFHRRGYRNVSVAFRSEPAPGGERVVYGVAAGPLATIASAQALGVPAGVAFVPALVPGAPLEERRVEQESARLKAALEEAGYPEAQVEAELREGGGAVPVAWRAVPGPHVVVAAFELSTPSPKARSEATRELRTRVGQPYRVRDLALDRNALLATWRNAGHPQVTVEPEVTFSEDRSEAKVAFQVEPGPRIDVDRIIVAGLTRTRESVVRRELLVKEGEPLGLANLLESQRRLGALGLFRRLSITELSGSAPGTRSLVVAAEEGPPTTFAYGLGYAEDDLLRGSLEVTRRNLGGMDRTLSAFVRASFRTTRVFLSYREPYLFGRRHELFVTAFREEEARPGFAFTRGGGLLQTGFVLSPRTSLIVRYSYEKTNTFDVTVPEEEVDREFQDATFSGPSASILDDTRDDALDPHRGHFVGADLRFSSAALGGDSFVKASLQASTYRRATARALVALSARLGLARTFGFEEPTRLPLPERFFAGGDFSLRGFPVDGVDEAGGNGLVLGSAELRFDLSRSIALAAFTDAGNVYPFVSDIDLGDIRTSAGIGVRYKTAFGPLRVDWAFKLDRREGESASRLHVAVGHAF